MHLPAFTPIMWPPSIARMNVPFRIRGGDEALEAKFMAEGSAVGIEQLFCHPLYPGLRITMYNGLPDSAVDRVVDFMAAFCAKHHQ